jgi:hypothetical protein
MASSGRRTAAPLDPRQLPDQPAGPHHPGPGRSEAAAAHRAPHRRLLQPAPRRRPTRRQGPRAQDRPQHPCPAPPGAEGCRPLGLCAPQPGRRRRPTPRHLARAAGLEPRAATRLPHPCARRPAVRALDPGRHHRHAPRGARRPALERHRLHPGPAHAPPAPGRRQLPGARVRPQDPQRPTLPRPRPGHPPGAG